ncbi:MAG: flagellar biosynthetic protein FliR [Roseovarius sp.]|nr:flagellar biosynthetic protein FliR [Roseovarius sp.]
MGLAAITAPALAPELGALARTGPDLARLIVIETAIGALLGIGIRLFVLALQTAGSIAAQSTSLAQILGGASVTPMPAIGHLLVTGALALAMILGLHVRLAEFGDRELSPVSAGPLARGGGCGGSGHRAWPTPLASH